MTRMKGDGLIVESNSSFEMIKDTKIGKIAQRLNRIESFYIRDSGEAVEPRISGPTLVFLYVKPVIHLSTGGITATKKR